MNSLLEISHLTFGFHKKPALADLSFTVSPGDHLSVLGPNGSGKSTLLRLINRILAPPAGSVKLMGRSIGKFSRKAIARHIAYVPQTHFKPTAFTVSEYLALARYPHNEGWQTPRTADREAIARALEDTGTAPLAHRPMNSLSGGEQQKVLIAAALAQEAPILLLDEATAFLDFKHKTDIHRLLCKLNRAGKTIVSVSHDINHAALNSNRIIALKGGTLVFDGEPDAFMTPEVMHQVFSEQFVFAAHPTDGRPVVVPRAVAE